MTELDTALIMIATAIRRYEWTTGNRYPVDADRLWRLVNNYNRWVGPRLDFLDYNSAPDDNLYLYPALTDLQVAIDIARRHSLEKHHVVMKLRHSAEWAFEALIAQRYQDVPTTQYYNLVTCVAEHIWEHPDIAYWEFQDLVNLIDSCVEVTRLTLKFDAPLK